jgi:phytoene/squalene synthetase
MSAAVGNAPVQFSPTPSQLDVAYSVCRHIARSAAKNFYYGFAVLPRPKRNSLSAVYAFMRRCDDITDDNTLSFYERRNKLAEWLDAVHRALAGYPTYATPLPDPARTARPACLRHRGGRGARDAPGRAGWNSRASLPYF